MNGSTLFSLGGKNLQSVVQNARKERQNPLKTAFRKAKTSAKSSRNKARTSFFDTKLRYHNSSGPLKRFVEGFVGGSNNTFSSRTYHKPDGSGWQKYTGRLKNTDVKTFSKYLQSLGGLKQASKENLKSLSNAQHAFFDQEGRDIISNENKYKAEEKDFNTARQELELKLKKRGKELDDYRYEIMVRKRRFEHAVSRLKILDKFIGKRKFKGF